MSDGATIKSSLTTLAQTQGVHALAKLPSRGLQELWFATLKKEWRTMVLVPTQAGYDMVALAEALSAIGQLHRGRPLRIVNAVGMDKKQLAELTVETREAPPGQPGRLVVLEPIVKNPLGTAVALAADAALLCVEYGVADLRDVKRTLKQIGPERFIGCAAVSRERK